MVFILIEWRSKHRIRMVLLGLALSLFASYAPHALGEVTIQVIDQHGKPVKDAVVSISATPQYNASKDVVVDQVNQQFFPQTSVIYTGQYVHFPNSDDIRHHVYSFSKAKIFEIKLYSGTPSAPLQFNEPGVVILGCNIHDRMVGYIYVADKNEVATLTNANGLVKINMPLSMEVKLWHPRFVVGPEQILVYKLSDAVEASVQEIKIELLPPPTKSKSGFKSRFNRS